MDSDTWACKQPEGKYRYCENFSSKILYLRISRDERFNTTGLRTRSTSNFPGFSDSVPTLFMAMRQKDPSLIQCGVLSRVGPRWTCGENQGACFNRTGCVFSRTGFVSSRTECVFRRTGLGVCSVELGVWSVLYRGVCVRWVEVDVFVRYQCGGWSEEVNSCILILSYMVYL